MNTGTSSLEAGAATDLKSERETACATRTRAWESGELVRTTRQIEAIVWNPTGARSVYIEEGDAMIIISAREIDALGISNYEFELLYGGIVVDYSVIMEHNFDVGYDFPFERV